MNFKMCFFFGEKIELAVANSLLTYANQKKTKAVSEWRLWLQLRLDQRVCQC